MLTPVKRSPHLSRILAALAAVVLVVQAVWMIASPDTVEGPILIVFDRGHGLTVSDLCGVALTLVALGLWFFVVFAPADPSGGGAGNKRAVAVRHAYADEGDLSRVRRDRPGRGALLPQLWAERRDPR